MSSCPTDNQDKLLTARGQECKVTLSLATLAQPEVFAIEEINCIFPGLGFSLLFISVQSFDIKPGSSIFSWTAFSYLFDVIDYQFLANGCVNLHLNVLFPFAKHGEEKENSSFKSLLTALHQSKSSPSLYKRINTFHHNRFRELFPWLKCSAVSKIADVLGQ